MGKGRNAECYSVLMFINSTDLKFTEQIGSILCLGICFLLLQPPSGCQGSNRDLFTLWYLCWQVKLDQLINCKNTMTLLIYSHFSSALKIPITNAIKYIIIVSKKNSFFAFTDKRQDYHCLTVHIIIQLKSSRF